MFNIGGPSTGSSSLSSLVGIGSSMQLDGLEAMTIFMNVSRDTGSKNLSVSIVPRSWQFWADSGQLSFGEIRRFKVESVICFLMIMIFSSKTFITAEVKAILSFNAVFCYSIKNTFWIVLLFLNYVGKIGWSSSSEGSSILHGTSSLVWRHFRSNFLEASYASYDKCF